MTTVSCCNQAFILSNLKTCLEMLQSEIYHLYIFCHYKLYTPGFGHFPLGRFSQAASGSVRTIYELPSIYIASFKKQTEINNKHLDDHFKHKQS